MSRSFFMEFNEADIVSVKYVIDYCRNLKIRLNSPNYVFDRKKQAPNALDVLSLVSSGLDIFELMVRSLMSHLDDDDGDEEDGGQVYDDDDGQVILSFHLIRLSFARPLRKGLVHEWLICIRLCSISVMFCSFAGHSWSLPKPYTKLMAYDQKQ